MTEVLPCPLEEVNSSKLLVYASHPREHGFDGCYRMYILQALRKTQLKLSSKASSASYNPVNDCCLYLRYPTHTQDIMSGCYVNLVVHKGDS